MDVLPLCWRRVLVFTRAGSRIRPLIRVRQLRAVFRDVFSAFPEPPPARRLVLQLSNPRRKPCEMNATPAMRMPLKVVPVLAAMVIVSAVGCAGNPKSSPVTKSSTTTSGAQTSPGSTPPADYAGLLIRASDINAPEVFTGSLPVNNPDGRVGVTTTFSNDDRSHVIYDTIEVLTDPAAAAIALDKRKHGLDGIVHGVPDPIDVGTGGTTVSGPAPDGVKGVTVLLFTEGRAFVELEFDGPDRMPAPQDFVTDVGRAQDEAIKKGLRG
jgi:hypothetical protein